MLQQISWITAEIICLHNQIYMVSFAISEKKTTTTLINVKKKKFWGKHYLHVSKCLTYKHTRLASASVIDSWESVPPRKHRQFRFLGSCSWMTVALSGFKPLLPKIGQMIFCCTTWEHHTSMVLGLLLWIISITLSHPSNQETLGLLLWTGLPFIPSWESIHGKLPIALVCEIFKFSFPMAKQCFNVIITELSSLWTEG